ncbi:MAG: phage tail protein [Alphaproteobacteria bacterium HGW-Alphaproteobacteria-16]|nr:MAG: phage tail protein [Alphaproteobacteria bacterium HGW-Alphaproteobacteria-16]
MSNDAESYQAQLFALLPPGPAWPREPDSQLGRLLAAWADEFARVDARVDQLLAEYDPRQAYELIDAWEAALGLPDPCTSGATSLSARQTNVWRKLAFVGGQTPAFYIALAASLGFEIEVHEFDPDVDDYDASLAAEVAAGRWRYIWRVHVLNAGEFTYFRMGDPFGGQFVEGDAAFDLECIIAAARPAHTHVIFTYPET